MKKRVFKVLISIIFVYALLMVVLPLSVHATQADTVSPEKASIIYSGKDGSLSWSIDSNGHLSVSGSGNYSGTYRSIKVANAGFSGEYPNWIAYKDEIVSAELKVTNIKDASCLFIGCTNLTQVNLTAFDMSKVTDMSSMFCGCEKLEKVNLGSSSATQVTDMNFLFAYCSSMVELDMSNIDATNVTKTTNMFSDCNMLKLIQSPKNISTVIMLPSSNKWYDGNGNVCTAMAQGLSNSVTYTTYLVKYMKNATINPIKEQTYNAKVITPPPVVTYQGKVLQKGKDYTVSYSNNVNPGTATVTVTGIGEYSGTKSVTFIIKVKLAKSKLGSVEFEFSKGNLQKMTTKTYYNLYVDFVPVSYATTYEIELSNNKGKRVKTVKVSCAGKNHVEKTIKNLTGSVYGVRIRAIRDGVYGAWSSKKYVIKQPRTQARVYQGNLQIKWEKISGATGYDIYMSTSRNGNYKKVASVGKKTTLKTIKKFKNKKLRNKTYFYYVVAKKKVSGKTYKSARNFVMSKTKN